MTAGTNPTSLAGYGITDAQPLDADLTALAGLSTTGIVCRTAANTFETRFIAVSTGLGASEPAGVGGNPTLFIANTGVTPGVYGSSSSVPQITVGSTGQVSLAANVSITPAGIGAQPADGDLTALANLAGTGFITRTAANTMANRTLVAGTGVLISNGDGISGNPSISSNITLTPPPLQNLSDAASAGVSTELARADHTHGFNVSGVTPGTYGDALNYPIITVNSQGQVTAASSQPLAPSGWQELINLSTITNTSNVTFVSITDLAITVTVGRRYRIEGQIIYRTAATTTGVGISLGAFSDGFSTAAGTVVGAVQTAIGSTGTAATYSGSITSLFNAVTSTSVSAANTDYLIELNAVFTCTASGLIIPIFRSEVNGSTVTVGIGSNLIAREFV